MDRVAFMAQLSTSFPTAVSFDEIKQHIAIGDYFVRATTFGTGVVCYSLLDKNLTTRLVVTKYPDFVEYVRKYLDGVPLVPVPETSKPVPVPEKRLVQHNCGHCLEQIDLETHEDLLSYPRDGRLVHRACHDETVAMVEESDRKAREIEEKRLQGLRNVSRPIRCNQCGQSCERGQWNENYGLIRAEVHGGYSSKELSDGVRYTFSICEGCLSDLFQDFEIPVQKVCYFDETPIEEGPRIASIRHGGVTIVGWVKEKAEELLEPKPQADYSDALDLSSLDPKVFEGPKKELSWYRKLFKKRDVT